MLQLLLIALGLALAPVLLMNLLGPLVIRRTQTLPGRVHFEPIEPETFFADRDAGFRRHDEAVRALVRDVLGHEDGAGLAESLVEVRERRARCIHGASRRARLAIDHADEPDRDQIEGEWLGYASLLVQVDRIVADLSAPLPP